MFGVSCPVCRQPYNHFPSHCHLLHFLLNKLYPLTYEKRERQVGGLTQAQQWKFQYASFPKNVYHSWLSGNGPKVHVGVGCDYCWMSPIIGERYKCKDCVESIGFDLCEACHNNSVKIPGRFNQQHKPEHKLEIATSKHKPGI